jgi:GDP-D-mannose dehydratase
MFFNKANIYIDSHKGMVGSTIWCSLSSKVYTNLIETTSIDLAFEGENENEITQVVACHNPKYHLPLGAILVHVDTQYYRPTEVDLFIGDSMKSKTKLGWDPMYDLACLMKEMMKGDLIFIQN